MSLSPGTRLGPYEIVAALGAGGMGEVYRARDTRLNRDVAVKMLPEIFAGNEQFRQRFQREAEAISSLNHPHICTLHDVGSVSSGTGGGSALHYLVMELLEGETLSERLQRGMLPLHEVLKVGRQIASALDAAHRRGIVHRDLKPGNIMLTKSGAKLLDFGLARTAPGEGAPVSGFGGSDSLLPTAMPTRGPLTAEGTILGTFQYMAPEQLEGAEADPRTDIFALGAVLYEMATGKRAFEGKSRTSLIAAIVSSQPAPISSIAPMSPPALDHVVRRCLEKDREDRWQSAHDVAAELQWIAEGGSQAGVAAPVAARRKSREKVAWWVAALLGLTAIALGVAVLSRPAPASRVFRASLSPPADHSLIPFDELGVTLSPDGKSLAFVAAAADGSRQIWIRSLGEMTPRRVPETQGAWYPFWSPDGGSLGFFADGKLKTIALRGGSPRILGDAPSGRGGSWGPDGSILFAPNISSPIHRMASTGGKAEPVSHYDPKTETTHRWPTFLPDGRHFLYVSRVRTKGATELGNLMLAAIGSPGATVLIEDATNALYVEPGFLIYGRAANLYAWRFDAESLKLLGQAAPIVPDKLSYWEPKNFIPFTASNDGTLVYLPEATRQTEMRWYDRQGRMLGTLGSPGYLFLPRVSPDGRKVAYVKGDAPNSLNDLWIRDLEFNRAYRLTQQSGLYGFPTWSPDSGRLAFLAQPKGVPDLFVMSLNAGAEMRLVYASNTWKTLGSWTPDGKGILFSPQDPETNEDIVLVSSEGGSEARPIVHTPFAETDAQVSPDGRRMAFTSDQSGRPEVYLRNLEGESGQWQISSEGGYKPGWRADGKELVYASGDGYAMSVSLQPGADPHPGNPQRLFQLPEVPDTFSPILEDMTRDGQRFLLNVPTTSRASIAFHAILNWPSILPHESK
jgi:Tol biopolymer transport system component